MGASKKTFKTEVRQLLDLVIHSLYTKKEIFLRELLSNASDAIDRVRFEALSDKSLLKDDPELKIKIHSDKKKRTVTISDNGIGMTREEVEKNIGTIARSGTRAFLDEVEKGKLKENPELIGQFGVGFYSAFMVADKVTLVTRPAGDNNLGCKWGSFGDGKYTIDDFDKDGRGTDVTVHLREDLDEFLEEWKIRKTVKQFSDYIAHPITMEVTREETPRDEDGKAIEDAEKIVTTEEETLNSMTAIWKKAKSEVKDVEYDEFYKHITHDYTDPLKVVRYSVEGVTEFKALLYIPSHAPWDMFDREKRSGIHLYVKNVFITDDCKELMPDYLRFVKGVVDSGDLPLNVSRETLQDDAVIRRISTNLVGKTLGTLSEMMAKTNEQYLKFYKEFGKVLKEGLHTDSGNREKLQELLLFESSKTKPGEYVSLKVYTGRMPSAQKEIYYIAGPDRNTVENSPHLEVLKSKDYEILFMTDPIDEWVVGALTEYDDKKLKPIDRGEVDIDTDEEKKEKEEKKGKSEKKFKALLEYVQGKLEEEVKEVRLSARLTASASCLVADEHAMSAHMERIMKAMNQDAPVSKRILELNPKHPIMGIMLNLFNADKKNRKLADYCQLLHDQALLTEGSPISDPRHFTKLVSGLMVLEGKDLAKTVAEKS